jgi:hypothetical protein
MGVFVWMGVAISGSFIFTGEKSAFSVPYQVTMVTGVFYGY